MTLRSTGRSRERILAYGMEGVGKSLLLLDIAARVHPNKVHVIDNDNAWDRMLEGTTLDGAEVGVVAEYRWDAKGEAFTYDDRYVSESGNIVVFHTSDWLSNVAAISDVREYAEPDDWCGVDTGSSLWDDVQAWFTDTVFKQSKASYFLQARMAIEAANKDATALGALDGWVDWPIINAEYKEKVMAFLVNPPCHLLVTAEQQEVSSGQVRGKAIEDADTRAMYGGRHVKPRGQKRMGHNMQSIINLTRGATGDFKAYTVKDRGGRERHEGTNITDVGFGAWYLEETAGWQETSESSSASETSLTPTTAGPASGSPSPKAKAPVAKVVAKG